MLTMTSKRRLPDRLSNLPQEGTIYLCFMLPVSRCNHEVVIVCVVESLSIIRSQSVRYVLTGTSNKHGSLSEHMQITKVQMQGYNLFEDDLELLS